MSQTDVSSATLEGLRRGVHATPCAVTERDAEMEAAVECRGTGSGHFPLAPVVRRRPITSPGSLGTLTCVGWGLRGGRFPEIQGIAVTLTSVIF